MERIYMYFYKHLSNEPGVITFVPGRVIFGVPCRTIVISEVLGIQQ